MMSTISTDNTIATCAITTFCSNSVAPTAAVIKTIKSGTRRKITGIMVVVVFPLLIGSDIIMIVVIVQCSCIAVTWDFNVRCIWIILIV